MDTGTAVRIKRSTDKKFYPGTVQKIVKFKSKWGDKLYHVLLDDGTLRIAFPDEVIQMGD